MHEREFALRTRRAHESEPDRRGRCRVDALPQKGAIRATGVAFRLGRIIVPARDRPFQEQVDVPPVLLHHDALKHVMHHLPRNDRAATRVAALGHERGIETRDVRPAPHLGIARERHELRGGESRGPSAHAMRHGR